MWTLIFFVGLPVALYMAVRSPALAACVAGYLYFGIPPQQFYAPNLPYQNLFWAIAALTAFRYSSLAKKWGREQLDEEAAKAAGKAVEHVQSAITEALVSAGAEHKILGEIRAQAAEAAESALDIFIESNTPRALIVPVRSAVRAAVFQACELGEKEVLEVRERIPNQTVGVVRSVLKTHLEPLVIVWLKANIKNLVQSHLASFIAQHEANASITAKPRSPLDVPIADGPGIGLLTNRGFWLHVLFTVMSVFLAKAALYNVPRAEESIDHLFKLLIPMVAIVVALRTADHVRWFSWAWMFGVLHIALNGVNIWLRYGGRADSAGGQGGEANFLGAIIVSVAPVAYGWVLNARSKFERYAALFFAGSYVLGVLASGSRAAFMALVLSAGYWALFTNRKTIAAGVGLIGVAGFLFVAPASFWERMGGMFGEKEQNPWVEVAIEKSAHERIVLWGLAIDLFSRHPVFGIGPRNYIDASAIETDITDAYQGQRGMQTHNSWLQLLSEYGLVGGGIWILAFVGSMWSLWRARRKMSKYPGWEWFPAMCLGFEAGGVGTIVCFAFNSFHWYDYAYWYFVFGPLVSAIATQTARRLDWFAVAEVKAQPTPPPRYGPPARNGCDLSRIDLADTEPLRS